MKQVSIILPTYNRAHCIGRAVESVLDQTYSAWELLVIDDGSTDNTEERIAAYAASDGRVRYCRQARNGGVSAARNEGIRQARYEYIAFQDSDDAWRADKLEKQMRVFEESPEAGLVYCAMQGTRQDGSAVRVPDASIDRRLLHGNLYELLLQGNVIGAPAAVVRRACMEQCGGFDETLSCLEDWELFLRIAEKYEIGYVDEPLVDADFHEGGVSSHAGGYFQARCRMTALHKMALLEFGLFNQVVERILLAAKEAGALEQVAKMLQAML
ncbi:MAG: glycosyltransferase [Lachnospiraceae bacterium]